MIQAQNGLSDDKAEFLINDRLSFMRFLGLGLSDRVPDAKTIWIFRERLTRAGAIDRLFQRFDDAIRAAGYIAVSGQLVDSTLVAAPKQRTTRDEKQGVKAGKSAREIWPDPPTPTCPEFDKFFIPDRPDPARRGGTDTAGDCGLDLSPLRSPADLRPPARGAWWPVRSVSTPLSGAWPPGVAGIGRAGARRSGFRAWIALDGGRRADAACGTGRGACGRRGQDRCGRGQPGAARAGGARRAASTCANSSCSG